MMEEPIITPEDEARYMRIMSDYDDAMLVHYSGPVPMCHFKPMTNHYDDSHPACTESWYECDYCGHTEDSAEAWAKVNARKKAKDGDA